MGEKGKWREGKVAPTREHIQVLWGPIAGEYENLVVVARLAPATTAKNPRTFVVETVLDPAAPHAADALAAVRKELDFYLVDLKEPNPWAYACYHCSTGANVYGHVHWACCR
jgi:hypothetical protein